MRRSRRLLAVGVAAAALCAGSGIALADPGEEHGHDGIPVPTPTLPLTPPGATNWLIGSAGQRKRAARPFGQGPDLPDGTVDAPGMPVTPVSLYLAQLADRLGPQAVKNAGH